MSEQIKTQAPSHEGLHNGFSELEASMERAAMPPPFSLEASLMGSAGNLPEIQEEDRTAIARIACLLEEGMFDEAYDVILSIEPRYEPLLIRRLCKKLLNEQLPFKGGYKTEQLQAIEKPNRPAPLNYLEEQFLQNHKQKFESEGAAFLVVSSWLEKGSYSSFPPNKYVMLRPDMESALAMYRSSGKIAVLEEALGFSLGDLEGLEDEIFIFFIGKDNVDFHMTTGNEQGANEFWTPGGATSGGFREATITVKDNPESGLVHNKSIGYLKSRLSYTKLH